jgi:hypothetical protein
MDDAVEIELISKSYPQRLVNTTLKTQKEWLISVKDFLIEGINQLKILYTPVYSW